jgi:hypothetical protein
MEVTAEMERVLPDLVSGRFGAWVPEVLDPRAFVAGGALRDLAASVISGDVWRPKDLDLFFLDCKGLERAKEAAEAAGWEIEEPDPPLARARHPVRSHYVDLVPYDLGEEAEPATVLTTFDFLVNAIGWDGQHVFFPPGEQEGIIADIAAHRTRVSPGHLFLRRPPRAARRLCKILALGYQVVPPDLAAYAENFTGPRSRR